ncbi:hypothetical protein R50072_01280 [Simiduia litorea]
MKCNSCGQAFGSKSNRRIDKNYEFISPYGFKGQKLVFRQMLDFERVVCPKCGNIEVDPNIKVFGLIRMKVFLSLFFGLLLISLLTFL